MAIRPSRSFVFLLVLFGILTSAGVQAQTAAPQIASSHSDSSDWARFSYLDAGEALLNLRKAKMPSEFALGFKTWLDSGRKVQEILSLLSFIRPPFKKAEIAALSDLIIDYDPVIRNRNLTEHGYSLEAYGDNRIELVLLNQAEKDCYARALRLSTLRHTSIAHFLTPDLEGRLCVWTGERKIFLGGPHFDYDRVQRILSHPTRPEDLQLPPDIESHAAGAEAPSSSSVGLEDAFDKSF